MIFVTVGTHEQQFDRLVKYMDQWAGMTEEEVVIQTGYSSYEPETAAWSRFYSYREMTELTGRARIVISHGGPASFLSAIRSGICPIVVPRKKEYGEHVNNHQVEFTTEYAKRSKSILVVEDVNRLGDVIRAYDELRKDGDVKNNTEAFCTQLENIVSELFGADA